MGFGLGEQIATFIFGATRARDCQKFRFEPEDDERTKLFPFAESHLRPEWFRNEAGIRGGKAC
jgi:hypothetical protein